MSTATTDPANDSAPDPPNPVTRDAPPAAEQWRPVQAVNLIVGRKLVHPIRDQAGLLLLAAGSLITERFKELLLQRGIHEVLLHEADAEDRPAAPGARPMPVVEQLDSQLTAGLDELVESGRLFVADSGPEFKQRLNPHGCTSYNKEHRELLVRQHAATCKMLDGMIKSALRGRPVNGDEVADVVGGFLSALAFDADCVLDVANQTRGYAELAEHCLQMSLLGMALAIEAGMSEADVRTIGLCGLVHDWGMTKVPEKIRRSNRVLSQADFQEIKQHPLYTLELLARVQGLPEEVALICFQVHEQPNGKGYPRGRRQEAIHPGAAILHVADAYCALTALRPYRLPLTPYGAVECLVRNARDKSVDPDVVRMLLHVLSLFPIGSYVLLNDTSTARVLRRNGNHYSAPIVQLVRRPDGSRLDPEREILIVDTQHERHRIIKALPTPGRQEVPLRPDVQRINRV